MKLLDMQHVTFRRQGKSILDDVTWGIEAGQHWALIGANGSGKTTLLKLLAAYEWASSGTIDVLGKRYGECHVGNHRKHMGWVSATLQRQLRGHEAAMRIVASGLEASFSWFGEWDDEVESQARAALDTLRIGHLAERTYETLSQGEQKRVQIARALVHTPELMILDEPCEGLDPVSRRMFLKDLAEIAEAGHVQSIVYVTHHIDEVSDWMSHLLVLKAGRILAQGALDTHLNEAVLGEAFGVPCSLTKADGVWNLRMEPDANA